jgi:hypothetical protein
MMYARCVFVTAARTHVLSVASAWMTVAGDDPMSNMWMNDCDQNSACGEFGDRYTFTSRIVLAVLLLSSDFGTAIRLVRDISSSDSCIRGDRAPACTSDGTEGASLLDWSLENSPGFFGFGAGTDGIVRLWTIG